MLDKIKDFKGKIILVDNIYTDICEYDNFVKLFPKSYRYIISNDVDKRRYYKDLRASRKNFVEVEIDGCGRYDELHTNSLGSQMYLEILEKEKIIEK